jgi:hypothetical protein
LRWITRSCLRSMTDAMAAPLSPFDATLIYILAD